MKISAATQDLMLKYGLAIAALAAVYFALKSSVGKVADSYNSTVDNLQGLSSSLPFSPAWWLDSAGAAGDLLSIPKPTQSNPLVMGYDASHIEAMRKIGLDINKYRVWYPNPLSSEPMPTGTIKVTWGASKEYITYYVPRTALDVWSF